MTEDNLEIEPAALKELRDSGADLQLVDVRDDWERAVCALPGSVDIPMMGIPNQISQLSTEQPVVVVCHSGMRSLQAANWMRDNGFPGARSLRGGLDAWAAEIDPTMARY
jgi:rhodanese-related sulfurtransferase